MRAKHPLPGTVKRVAIRVSHGVSSDTTIPAQFTVRGQSHWMPRMVDPPRVVNRLQHYIDYSANAPATQFQYAYRTKPAARFSTTYMECYNLLGDTIWSLPVIKKALNGRTNVVLKGPKGLAGEVIRNTFKDNPFVTSVDELPLSLDPVQFKPAIDVGPLSVDTVINTWVCKNPGVQKNYIGIAPYSVSGNFGNKVLTEAQWTPILSVLRQYGYELRVIDQGNMFSSIPAFKAQTLDELVLFLYSCHVVVSIDTGICHVAASAGVPLIVLWSAACAEEWAPTWSASTRLVRFGAMAPNANTHKMATEVAKHCSDFFAKLPTNGIARG